MCFRRKEEHQDDLLRYCGYAGTPYELTAFPPDCYVKDGMRSIATFETMTLHDDVLHIDHFALDGSLRGSGLGEPVLRGFARLVAKQAPQIVRITFDLNRSTEDSDIERLAQARCALLQKIDARQVRQRRPRQDCICVSGTWHKAQWSLLKEAVGR